MLEHGGLASGSVAGETLGTTMLLTAATIIVPARDAVCGTIEDGNCIFRSVLLKTAYRRLEGHWPRRILTTNVLCVPLQGVQRANRLKLADHSGRRAVQSYGWIRTSAGIPRPAYRCPIISIVSGRQRRRRPPQIRAHSYQYTARHPGASSRSSPDGIRWPRRDRAKVSCSAWLRRPRSAQPVHPGDLPQG